MSGTLGRATVRELSAIVPPMNSGAPLDALHPSILGRLIWEPQTLSELLGGRAAEIKLSLDVTRTAEAVKLTPKGLIDVESYPFLEKAKPADLRAAERFIAQYWTGFCRETASWVLGSGVSKLVIAGKLHTQSPACCIAGR